MRVRMTEIAREAKVSPATVSLVLNGKETAIRISRETRERILSVARSLGYRPNRLAKGLASGRTCSLGLAIYDLSYLTHYYFSAILGGVASKAAEYDYHMQFMTTKQDAEKSRCYFERKVQEVDGLIIVDQILSEQKIEELCSTGLPTVLIDRQVTNVQANCVLADYRRGFYEATKHMIEQGHSDVVAMIGSYDTYDNRIKISGYDEALEEYGMTDRRRVVLVRTDEYRHLQDDVEAFFAETPRCPSSLVTGGDSSAVAVLNTVHGLGKEVPADVAVIGFGDQPITATVRPMLSSVHVPCEALGIAAAEMLIGSLGMGDVKESPVVLDTSLVIRDSSEHKVNR